MTLKDIARECGLSVATVSDILNKSDPRYSSATRARVVSIAERLKYRPDPQARVLRGCKSGVIGILQGIGLSSFAAERSLAVAEAVREIGFGVLTCDMGWHREMRSACDQMLDAHVEGILLVSPVDRFPVAEIRRFQKAKISLASMSGVELPGVPQVRADVRSGMRNLTKRLISNGRQNLVFLSTSSALVDDRRQAWPALERIDGFEDAVLQAGGIMMKQLDDVSKSPADCVDTKYVCGRVVCCPFGKDSDSPYATAEALTRGILSWESRPDALLCVNDDWAIGALAVCRERGVCTPETLAVTGFDGSLLGASASPRLTTVAQPLNEMARLAVDLLLRQIRGEELSLDQFIVRLPCQVVVRASCGSGGIGKEVELSVN